MKGMINIDILKLYFQYLKTGELNRNKDKSIKYIYDDKNNLIGYYVFDKNNDKIKDDLKLYNKWCVLYNNY